MAASFTASGSFYVRSEFQKEFCLIHVADVVQPYSTLAVRPDNSFPLATDSVLVTASHSVTVYPGGVIKILPSGFELLAGRAVIVSPTDESVLKFYGKRFSAYFKSGKSMIEVFPAGDVRIAMFEKGTLIVKDLDRAFFSLESGHEVLIPKFGKSRLSRRLSSIWSQPPSSFSSLRLPSEVIEPMVDDAKPGQEKDEISEKDNESSAFEQKSLDNDSELLDDVLINASQPHSVH